VWYMITNVSEVQRTGVRTAPEILRKATNHLVKYIRPYIKNEANILLATTACGKWVSEHDGYIVHSHIEDYYLLGCDTV
jgi:hypothetical protein